MDTKNTKEALALLFTAATSFKNAKADGSLDAADLGHLIPIFADAGPAFKDIGEVPKELGDLDEVEAQDLIAFCQQKLPGVVDKPSLVRKINKGLVVLVALVGFLTELKKEDLVASA